MKMRKFFLAAVSVAALSPVAYAADMAPAPTVYDWSGVYIGLNAGVAWSNSEVDGDLDCAYTGSSTGSAGDLFCDNFDAAGDALRHGVDDGDAVFSGGAMIGANWQWEAFVLGVEADVNYANFGSSGSSDYVYDPLGQDTADYISTRAELDANWWGTLRGRMGFAADNWLFYGTGGLAWGAIDASARIDYCFDVDCNTGWTARGSESETLIGWTAGAGIEYGWDNWTFGAEYLYVDLGSTDFDHNYALNGGVSLPTDVAVSGNADVDYQFSVVRATAKLKF